MNTSRRQFFSRFGRSLVAELADATESLRTAGSVTADEPPASPPRLWVRPPGALREDAFRATCTQCTDCQEACPYDSIRRLEPEFGPNAGTPAIIPHESPCYLCEDMPCVAACEPRALVPTALSEVRMGLAVLHKEKCYLSKN